MSHCSVKPYVFLDTNQLLLIPVAVRGRQNSDPELRPDRAISLLQSGDPAGARAAATLLSSSGQMASLELADDGLSYGFLDWTDRE